MKLVDMITEMLECERLILIKGITTCSNISCRGQVGGYQACGYQIPTLISLDDAALATIAGGQGLGGYAGSDFYGGPNGFGGWGTVATPEGVMVWHAVSGPSGFNIWLGQGYTSLA